MEKPLALGRALHLVRARQKLTRQQLVDRALAVDTGYDGEGLSPSSLNRSENGERSPRIHELMAICEATGISLVEFFRLYQKLVDDAPPGEVATPSATAGPRQAALTARVRRLLSELDLDPEVDLEMDLHGGSARLHVHLHLPPGWPSDG